jgi:MFS family permease
MMASLSTKYYQFILSQSICSSIGASMLFYPASSCLATWFMKKRAVAFSIAACGSSLGGVIFPIMVRRLIEEIGFGWAMRTCAFLVLALSTVASLTIQSRIAPTKAPFKAMDFVRPVTEYVCMQSAHINQY